jgi:hypothetical protein
LIGFGLGWSGHDAIVDVGHRLIALAILKAQG